MAKAGDIDRSRVFVSILRHSSSRHSTIHEKCCDLPGLYLVLQPSDTPAMRFSTYRNCTCVMSTTTEFPIVELSDIARNMQDRTRLKERFYRKYMVLTGYSA
ncbi:hypothetical protein C8R48DRAFT_668998 [Suillus tomentosus]|nr:hypothetical protein C8R48DRAFT_668998 [Suillus tomentosus]